MIWPDEVLILFGNLPRQIDSSLYSSIQIFHELLIQASPWEVNNCNQIQNLFVHPNSIVIVFDLIKHIEKTTSQQHFLFMVNSVLLRVVAFSDVVFEGGEEHDEKGRGFLCFWDET